MSFIHSLLVTLLAGILIAGCEKEVRASTPAQHAEATSSTTNKRNSAVITNNGVDRKTAILYAQTKLLPNVSQIADSYPILKIRTSIRSFIGRVNNGEIKLDFIERFAPGESMDSKTMIFQASRKTRDGKSMVFFIPQWMGFNIRNPDDELIKDYLAATILHEMYHLDKQALRNPNTIEADEEQAWRYTCREVVDPQVKAGRYKGLAAYDTDSLAMCSQLKKFGPKSKKWLNNFKGYAKQKSP